MWSFFICGSPGRPPRLPPVLLRCSMLRVLSQSDSRIPPVPSVVRSPGVPSCPGTWCPAVHPGFSHGFLCSEVVSRLTTSTIVLPHRSNLLMQRQSLPPGLPGLLELDPLLLWGPTADLLREDPVAPCLLQLLHLGIGGLSCGAYSGISDQSSHFCAVKGRLCEL